mmetsp:Transcript_4007/g.10555  ORF Transcript_4007/g.10555 Transcript_4007/m.10555 type:complete len:97 (+) Transcript_4007:172-462(+)
MHDRHPVAPPVSLSDHTLAVPLNKCQRAVGHTQAHASSARLKHTPPPIRRVKRGHVTQYPSTNNKKQHHNNHHRPQQPPPAAERPEPIHTARRPVQ